MKRKIGSLEVFALGAFLMISAISSFAQQIHPAPDRAVLVEHETMIQGPEGPHPPMVMQGPEGPHPPIPPHGDFVFIASEMSFDGKLVKGAPYSAQAITESTQTLRDGNRIVNKSTAAVYRDSEGRTRREQTLRAIGSFANGGELPQTIFISDPVAGTSYTLDPRAHVARKMPPMRFKFQFKTPPPPGEKPDTPPEEPLLDRIEIEHEVFGAKMAPEAGVVMQWHGTREGKARRESLGKQSFEGVEAEGSRSTVTIPAGEIGNEQAIEIVNESWYSPDLQTVVMTRHSDPRFGETSYRLTNINRTEPARALFEIPAGYTVKEDQMLAPERLRMRRRVKNPE